MKGTLLYKDGSPVQKKSVALVEPIYENGKMIGFRGTGYDSHTDENGAFEFNKIKSGEYLIGHLESTMEFSHVEQWWARNKNNDIFIFKIPKNKGIYIGNLTLDK